MIHVTKTTLPPMSEYVKYLQGVWGSHRLTNFGPLSQELEKKLRRYLGVKHLFFVSNGTVGLQIAIKAIGVKGEIITTPLSYVATTSSIVWENCKPVFVDVDPATLTMDASKIERHLTQNTRAILATHIYGTPCDTVRIAAIARKYSLKVIYDAAHAFGVKYRGSSLAEYGDISVFSFHATKLFHTVEGGAIATNNQKLAKKISYLRDFGHKSQTDFSGLGTNGKNSEFHAAMGLCLLPRVKSIIESRRKIFRLYDKMLADKTKTLRRPSLPAGTQYNFSYYPVIFKNTRLRQKVTAVLNKKKVFPRRYFYPALTKLDYVGEQSAPIAEDIAERVLCLPLYGELKQRTAKMICRTVLRELDRTKDSL